jgi:hypothetical protein
MKVVVHGWISAKDIWDKDDRDVLQSRGDTRGNERWVAKVGRGGDALFVQEGLTAFALYGSS